MCLYIQAAFPGLCNNKLKRCIQTVTAFILPVHMHRNDEEAVPWHVDLLVQGLWPKYTCGPITLQCSFAIKWHRSFGRCHYDNHMLMGTIQTGRSLFTLSLRPNNEFIILPENMTELKVNVNHWGLLYTCVSSVNQEAVLSYQHVRALCSSSLYNVW